MAQNHPKWKNSSQRDSYKTTLRRTKAGESTRYHYVLVVFDEKLTDSLKNSMTKKSCSQHGSIQLFTGEWLRKNGNCRLWLAKIDFLPKDKWSQWIKYAITMESITHIKSLLRLEFKVKHCCSTLTLINLRFSSSFGKSEEKKFFRKVQILWEGQKISLLFWNYFAVSKQIGRLFQIFLVFSKSLNFKARTLYLVKNYRWNWIS